MIFFAFLYTFCHTPHVAHVGLRKSLFNHYEDQSFSSAGAELPARRFGSDDEPRDPSAALRQALPELRRQTQPTGGGLQVRGHGPQRPRAQSARRPLRRQRRSGAQPPALL